MTRKRETERKAAISLRYDSVRDKAPRVTSKGRGLMAEKIIALARESNIPIKEDPDLVQILAQVEVGREIPASVYKVVAELLAFVYRLNQEYPGKAPDTHSPVGTVSQ